MQARSHGPGISAALCVLLVLLVGGAAQAAPDLDILASAGLGDELGGRPIVIDLTGDDGVLLLGERHGQGTLTRLDRFGAAGPVQPLAGRFDDLAVDRRSGNVVVVGATGISVFSAELAPLWQRPLPAVIVDEPARKVAIGERGTVAALAAGEIHVFSPEGRALGQADADSQVTQDLAVLDEAGLVVTTGWSTRRACEVSLDVAGLSAFTLDGAPRWRVYGDTSEDELCDERRDNLASTRGLAVARGEDGLVYLLAETDGGNNIFRGRRGEDGAYATNIAFDPYTDPETAHPALMAYYARFSPAGEHLLGQYFLLPAEGSEVHGQAIAADVNGNVYIAGSATHSLGAADDVAITEALDAEAGFLQIVEPDFEARRLWSQVEADGLTTDLSALALAGDRVVTLMHAATGAGGAGGSVPTGPSVLLWPGGFGPVATEKRPEPDTQGTFGYESGVSGSDPTCYCDSSHVPGPGTALALVSFTLVCLRRPRRRA